VKKKTRMLPGGTEGIKAPFFFHKDPKKVKLALLASFITESRRQGWEKSATLKFYEFAAQRGELGILQKFLDADDCETITDGKLFNAYKLALADSDELFGSLTGAVDWDRTWRSGTDFPRIDRVMTDGEFSQMLWTFASVHDFAYFLSKYAATPPTLASVRYYFGRVYPQNAGLWPNDKDKNHDMARKFRKWKLPLTRGKAGRPQYRGKTQK
jgi:hypothetical protein